MIAEILYQKRALSSHTRNFSSSQQTPSHSNEPPRLLSWKNCVRAWELRSGGHASAGQKSSNRTIYAGTSHACAWAATAAIQTPNVSAHHLFHPTNANLVSCETFLPCPSNDADCQFLQPHKMQSRWLRQTDPAPPLRLHPAGTRTG